MTPVISGFGPWKENFCFTFLNTIGLFQPALKRKYTQRSEIQALTSLSEKSAGQVLGLWAWMSAYMRGTARDTVVTREGFNDEITQKGTGHSSLKQTEWSIVYFWQLLLIIHVFRNKPANPLVNCLTGNFGSTTSVTWTPSVFLSAPTTVNFETMTGSLIVPSVTDQDVESLAVARH